MCYHQRQRGSNDPEEVTLITEEGRSIARLTLQLVSVAPVTAFRFGQVSPDVGGNMEEALLLCLRSRFLRPGGCRALQFRPKPSHQVVKC